jgi:hypothetical protein
MKLSSRRRFIKLAALGSVTVAVTALGLDIAWKHVQQNPSTHTTNTSFPGLTKKRYIRLRTIGTTGWQDQYAGVSYSPQDILNIITDLQPTLLERYINGLPNGGSPDYVLPGGMNIVDFLDSSVKAGAIGCYMTPRLGCELIYNNGGDTTAFFDLSSKYLDFPVKAPWREVSVDNFAQLSQQYPTMVESVLQELYSQGWNSVGVTDFDSYWKDYGLATFTLVGFDKSNNWQVKAQLINAIRENSPNIKTIIGTIDYPGPTEDLLNIYNNQGGDAVANIIRYIFQNQNQYGYIYSPDILMDDSVIWDSMRLSYSGGTLYDLIRSELEEFD